MYFCLDYNWVHSKYAFVIENEEQFLREPHIYQISRDLNFNQNNLSHFQPEGTTDKDNEKWEDNASIAVEPEHNPNPKISTF